MFCLKCGYKLSGEENFCPVCGATIVTNVVSSEVSASEDNLDQTVKIRPSNNNVSKSIKEKRKIPVLALASVVALLMVAGIVGTIFFFQRKTHSSPIKNKHDENEDQIEEASAKTVTETVGSEDDIHSGLVGHDESEVLSSDNNKDYEPPTDIITDFISDDSEVLIYNYLDDGTFWANEYFPSEGIAYAIHANILGEVFERYTFDKIYKDILYGVNDELLICGVRDVGSFTETRDIRVLNIKTAEDLTEKYVGDYDKIYDYVKNGAETSLIIQKTAYGFEEEYDVYKFLRCDMTKQIEVSLRSDDLRDSYNITGKKQNAKDIELVAISSEVFCIRNIVSGFDGDGPTSLFINLGKQSIVPLRLEYGRGNYCLCTEKDYTTFHNGNDVIVIDWSTGQIWPLGNDKYRPKKISEGCIFAEVPRVAAFGSEDEYVLIDIYGNSVIDANQYLRKVKNIDDFYEGIAPIEFEDNYISFIDKNGELIFDPIKGFIWSYNKGNHIAVICFEDKVFSLDSEGNTETLEFPPYGCSAPKYIEYHGCYYWVANDSLRLSVHKMVDSNSDKSSYSNYESSRETINIDDENDRLAYGEGSTIDAIHYVNSIEELANDLNMRGPSPTLEGTTEYQGDCIELNVYPDGGYFLYNNGNEDLIVSNMTIDIDREEAGKILCSNGWNIFELTVPENDKMKVDKYYITVDENLFRIHIKFEIATNTVKGWALFSSD